MKTLIAKIDFGYACISSVIKDCSTASTVPLSSYNKLHDLESKIFRLERVARSNLTNTIRLLWHNIAEGIKLYRFSSQLIPLANHPSGQVWDFTDILKDELSKIGNIVKDHGLKVSTHPGQYTVINTPDNGKYNNTVQDLIYHDKVLQAMGLDENAIMVIHVGGVYGDKKASLERFKYNFQKLPTSVKKRIAIENDDTSYSISDVLELCKFLQRPMVLDVHHHNCYNQGEELIDFLEDIFSTWENLKRPPKIHFSSPKSKEQPLYHADYIDTSSFKEFLILASDFHFDVMIEAKKQDAALLKLWKELGYSPE